MSRVTQLIGERPRVQPGVYSGKTQWGPKQKWGEVEAGCDIMESEATWSYEMAGGGLGGVGEEKVKRIPQRIAIGLWEIAVPSPEQGRREEELVCRASQSNGVRREHLCYELPQPCNRRSTTSSFLLSLQALLTR